MLWFWYIFLFLLGAAIGSFLNVCIARLPQRKSVLWPLDSRCGQCLQKIGRKDNIPLLSYWLLGGKCRKCGARFSMRYFWVELLTAAGFVALFYMVVVDNIHQLVILRQERAAIQAGLVPWPGLIVFAHHAVLFCLLLVLAACDLDQQDIPLSVTVTGMVLGLGFAVLFAWPWPYTLPQALQGVPERMPWWLLAPNLNPRYGLYPWPVAWPLPHWLPAGSWQLGLAGGLAGMLVGGFLLRIIRSIFNYGLREESLGLGDADLMMMAGAFLGWQPIVVAFFVSVFPGLIFGLLRLVVSRSKAFPFGPSLAMGVLITLLGWNWIGPRMLPLFFNSTILMVMVLAMVFFLVVSSLAFRLLRRGRATGQQPTTASHGK